jgi:hypothetical protein
MTGAYQRLYDSLLAARGAVVHTGAGGG